ncbi:MAG TPA: hypothetical protein VKU41_17605 [Polyangiaceae bacterium]|nr:hypothetical protein [Polyangiaceae bacterium]
MVRRQVVGGMFAALLSAAVACGGKTGMQPGTDAGAHGGSGSGAGSGSGSSGSASGATAGATAGAASTSGSGSSSGGEPPGPRTLMIPGTTAMRTSLVTKIDLLFVIDNSPTMSDKQALLAASVPDLLDRMVSPRCVDSVGNSTGVNYSDQAGCGATGIPEFPPIHDLHVGIVTASLGGRGSDQCAADTTNTANMALSAHTDDQGHLINRAGADEAPVADAQPDNFLAWFPSTPVNAGATPPPVKALQTFGSAGQTGTLVGDFSAMISGVHEHGCAFNGPNEAWYRFLVQPDPYASIAVRAETASLSGVDATILKQRADFLRPDSLLVVVVVTERSEALADPLAIGGQGWVFANSTFPGSPNFAAPEGSIECKDPVDPGSPTTTGPYGAKCTSCAFLKSDPSFATRCPNDGTGTGGYLDPQDDQLNVRFFHQKLRFGVSVMYPTSRYVRGLSGAAVPDSAHEHDASGNYVGDTQADCVNPIFATNLPTDPTADLCGLQRGPRTQGLVFYTAIAGVPHQLLQQDPTNPDSPQKDTLSAADWKLVMGTDPEHYDFTGADYHMIESTVPRTADNLPPGVVNASPCPPGSADKCDPMSGREIDTKNGALQFACIFPLEQPKDCTDSTNLGACDCTGGGFLQDSPLCQQTNGAYTTTQVASRAYPSVREMVIAHALGSQGIVSSLCPIHTVPTNGDSPPDPLWGYRPAMETLTNRIKPALKPPCLPMSLPVSAQDGTVACQVLVVLPGAGGSCLRPQCDPSKGLSVPAADILSSFCSAAEMAWQAAGGGVTGNDPAGQSVCTLSQLTAQQNPKAFDSTGSCAAPEDGSLGWCYATGAAAGACPQAVLFTSDEPPLGSAVYLKCN